MNKDDQKEYGHRLIALRAELEELETMSAEACKPVAFDQSMVGRLFRIDAMQGV